MFTYAIIVHSVVDFRHTFISSLLLILLCNLTLLKLCFYSLTMLTSYSPTLLVTLEHVLRLNTLITVRSYRCSFAL